MVQQYLITNFLLYVYISFQLIIYYTFSEMGQKQSVTSNNIYFNRYQIKQQIRKDELFFIQDHQQKKLKILQKIAIASELEKVILQEIKLSMLLHHPNLMKIQNHYVHKINSERVEVYITMEYFQANTLQQMVSTLKDTEILKIYQAIRSVLQYLHNKQVIYFDILFKNILVDKLKKHIKLLPSLLIAHQLEQSINHKILSTLQIYNSLPPQTINNNILSCKNDYWQLGILLLEMIIKKPFSQLIIYENELRHPAQNSQFPQYLFKKYNINKNFQEILKFLLQKYHKDRYLYHNEKEIDKINSSEKSSSVIIIYSQQDELPRNDYLKIMESNNDQFIEVIHNRKNMPLIELDISNCYLTDQIGITIHHIKTLKNLNVSGNQLSDMFTEHLGSLLQHLVSLNMSFTNITDKSLDEITKQKNFLIIPRQVEIEELDVSYTKITSAGIVKLRKLKKLTKLRVWSDPNQYPSRYYIHANVNFKINHSKLRNHKIEIDDQCLEHLEKLKLQELTINIQEKSLNRFLKNMKSDLTCVEVIGQINLDHVEQILMIKSLQNVYFKTINGIIIKQFESRSLKSVALVNCTFNLKALVKELQKCRNLKDLNLNENQLGNQGVKEIIKLKNLSSLSLANNLIHNQGVKQITLNLKKLIILNLSYNSITDEGALDISKQLKNLIILNLSFNSITNEGAEQIAANLTKLQSLNLKYNKVASKGGLLIAEQLQNLKFLDLQFNALNIDTCKHIKQIIKQNAFIEI